MHSERPVMADAKYQSQPRDVRYQPFADFADVLSA